MIEINRHPSRRELLWFGVLLIPFFALLGTMARFQWSSPTAARWIWIGGALLSALFWIAPPCRRLIYVGWIYAAFPIGWAISHLLLGIVYYLVVTPIGRILRLFGHDPLGRKKRLESYWEEYSPSDEPERYFRQF